MVDLLILVALWCGGNGKLDTVTDRYYSHAQACRERLLGCFKTAPAGGAQRDSHIELCALKEILK